MAAPANSTGPAGGSKYRYPSRYCRDGGDLLLVRFELFVCIPIPSGAGL